MNIAIFTDSFYPSTGGTEKAVYSYASALVQNGHNVLVACPKAGKCTDNYNFSVARFASIPVTSNDFCAIRMSKANIKKIVDFKPDIIHIQTVSPMCKYGLKLAKKLNIPVITTVHTKFKQAFKSDIKIKFIVDLLIKKMVKRLNQSDAVCTVSNEMTHELASYGFDGKINVIRNGMTPEKRLYDQKIIDKLKQKHNILNEPIFLFVGRIVKEKNLNFITEALSLLPKNLDFKMIFVGKGKYLKELKRQIAVKNLTKKVIITGKIYNQADFQAYIAISDLLLFPSLFDNDPLVLIEAACEKTPALVLENCGSSERIINGKNGFITENNPQKFADKIIEILKDKNALEQCGIEASKTIPTTWQKTILEYEKIYNIILKENKKN